MACDPTDLIREADAALDGITPEPWSIVTSEHGQIAVVNAETKFFIALLHPDDQGTEVGESNVRLIAAAPDLVRRLRDALGAERDTTKLAMTSLTRALDVLAEASGLPDEATEDTDLLYETVLGLPAALAEANATIERVRALADEWMGDGARSFLKRIAGMALRRAIEGPARGEN